jgi:hypothetical protein
MGQCLLDEAVHVKDRIGRQAAAAVPAALQKRLGISRRNLRRPQLAQVHRAEHRADILFYDLGVTLMSAGRHLGLNMPKPLIEKLHERHLGRLHVAAALQFGN